MACFNEYYHDYEVVTNGERINRMKIPRDAFRESWANAIVHRDYHIKSNIHIEFCDDYIKIISPEN